MKKEFKIALTSLTLLLFSQIESKAQIVLQQDYTNYNSATIGTFQNISFRESGFSGLFPIANTNGKEFWTVSDRGVNVDCQNANSASCHPTYDKMYAFANYAPKIHRIRINGDSLQILQSITMKRPTGSGATGLLNPTGFGSTAAEVCSTDTVANCADFNLKTAAKDIWGIDSEGIVVDQSGNFWICEEGGPTIWKLNANGVVVNRFTPYASLPGAQPQDIIIDSVFKYRKNNRGFEGIAITPNGKIYAVLQSPALYPNTSTGEGTTIHRILEINPLDNSTQMFVYTNEGIIGASGPNQIRYKDWKLGDMFAINNNEFLVIEAAARGTTDIKKMYRINISGATPVTSGLYSGVTLEALVNAAGLSTNGIVPASKTLFMDLLANGWPAALDKAEGLAILNDSTIAICNDNDFASTCPLADGIALSTTNVGHIIKYGLSGSNKITGFQAVETTLNQGQTAQSTSQSPYLIPSVVGAKFTSILSAKDVIGGYKMCGLPDGLGAYDNGNGTFTVLMNHEMGNTAGVTRAHGSLGAFVSKWIINKSDLTVLSGSDLIQNVNLWNGTGYTMYNAGNPSSLAAFGRFCSADLPAVSAYYNNATGLGTQERIFMNGEESGSEGRMFGHIATGVNAGTTYELPYLGKFSAENLMASPYESNKTIVAGTDDATPGQVYFYIGTKTNTGTEIDKAGLTGGKVFGVAVSGLLTETSASVPPAGTAFTLFDLGIVNNATGSALNTASNAGGVTTFLRPEDGAWDPSNPSDFYFVTTNAFVNPSRLWKLHFTNIANPELGGTITAVLDGTEGQKMLDNMTIDNYGHAILQEDPGNQSHFAKTWQYTIATDVLTQIASQDGTRFLSGGANYLTQDEEVSGVIDVQGILGAGMFIVTDQAHYGISGEVVEGGQLLALFNPDTYNSNPEILVQGNSVDILDGDSSPLLADNTDFGNVNTGSPQTKTFVIQNAGPGSLSLSGISFSGTHASEFTLISGPTFPLTIASSATQSITVQFAPMAIGLRTANIRIASNDFDENLYDYALQGTGVCTLPTAVVTSGGATTFCIGGSVSLTATAGATSYLWSTGATTSGITVNTSGSYSVTVTDVYGCTNVSSATSVVVNPLPVATISAAGSTNICTGDSLLLTASSGVVYQWYFNGTPISGATSGTYYANSQGDYSVNVNDGNCSATSSNTYITLYSLPAVPLISQSGSILSSTFATTYQWYLNGTPISGATSQTYAITANGTYSVVTTNSVGCEETSAPWVVTTTDIASAQITNEVNVYPNPYSEFTTIQINILENANVLAEVYNVLGEKVQTITNSELSAGNYNYTFAAKQLGYSAGIYFVKVTINDKIQVIKIVENN